MTMDKFVHPGADVVVRVMTLKTAEGTLKSPVVKTEKLPVSRSEGSSINQFFLYFLLLYLFYVKWHNMYNSLLIICTVVVFESILSKTG